jgi:quinol monooxygenase YgiN
MLTVIATMHVKAGSEDAAREILAALVAPTRKEKGCLNYDLHQRTDKRGTFVFYENWTTPAALDLHLQTAHVQKALAEMQPHLEGPPDIAQFEMVSRKT